MAGQFGSVARLLDSEPDENRVTGWPDRLLYNLLLLCSRLGDRDQLGPPLLRMYDRAAQRRGLRGHDWQGLDLCDPLRSALIANEPYRSVGTGDKYLDENVRPM